MEVVDVLIKNGHVIDPANDVHGVNDVAIKNGKIFAVGESLKLEANDSSSLTNEKDHHYFLNSADVCW